MEKSTTLKLSRYQADIEELPAPKTHKSFWGRQTDILHIDCVLHTMSDFLYRKGPDGRPLAERFPPYTPLLEMVKALAGAGT